MVVFILFAVHHFISLFSDGCVFGRLKLYIMVYFQHKSSYPPGICLHGVNHVHKMTHGDLSSVNMINHQQLINRQQMLLLLRLLIAKLTEKVRILFYPFFLLH